MNKHPERETKPVKFHVTQHPLKDGQVRIEFRRWPEDVFPRFTSTVHESKLEEEMQRFQEAMEKDEERQQDIARKLFGDK